MERARKRQEGSELPLGEPVRIDLANECVWRGKAALRLTPKAFAVLRYLLEHCDRLVTRDELL
jgi:DNA-binding response OmpR family regulator